MTEVKNEHRTPNVQHPTSNASDEETKFGASRSIPQKNQSQLRRAATSLFDVGRSSLKLHLDGMMKRLLRIGELI
jgi:hypothetical protein